jgi:glycosyltransferase involved in cell wall biosynthesis
VSHRRGASLVFVTQQVDPSHPALGATVAKVAALAERVDDVVVLADGAVEGALPSNCRVSLFRSGTRAGRGARFEAALARELGRRPRPVAVVAHMCPIYAVLSAPLARPLGVPVLLWFTHWRASGLLRLAERLSSRVLTVDQRSFPLPSSKVVTTGHGIDLSAFPCVERPLRSGLSVLTLGRTSPAKGLETVLRAVALRPEATLCQLGPSLTAEERTHRLRLEQLAAELGVDDRVTVGGAVPRDRVPGVLADADVLVNNMRPGATDKVVFEAAATCLPVLASNPALDGFLPTGLRFARDDAQGLASRLGEVAAADRGALGGELRAAVERDHSVAGWAERVLEVVG